MLDMPCGHGRVTRALRAAFPAAELVACDIDTDGVSFCRDRFGAVPVASCPDPMAVELPGTFDLIWVGSLFTHLPSASWHPFLQLFARSLVRGGVLCFTAAGPPSPTTSPVGSMGTSGRGAPSGCWLGGATRDLALRPIRTVGSCRKTRASSMAVRSRGRNGLSVSWRNTASCSCCSTRRAAGTSAKTSWPSCAAELHWRVLHYFIHVPKTAGATVRAWLAQAFARDEILFVYPGTIPEAPDALTYDFDEVVREAERMPASVRLMFGHYHFVAEWFSRSGGRGLGFVRDPRERVISWHRYVVREAERLPGPEMAAIAAAVRAGRSGLRELYEELGLADLDNAIVRYFAAAADPVGAIGERHLQRAIDNVDRHFDFVGHVRWFEQSMDRLASILGRPYRGAGARNVSPGGSSRAAATGYDAAFLDSITRYDRAFVDYVEAAFFAGQP